MFMYMFYLCCLSISFIQTEFLTINVIIIENEGGSRMHYFTENVALNCGFISTRLRKGLYNDGVKQAL